MKYKSIPQRREAWTMLLFSYILFHLTTFTPLYWLVFICFVPFFISLKKFSYLKDRLLAGFIFGMLYFSLSSFWFWNINPFIFCAVIVYQSCYMLFFSGMYHVLLKDAQERPFSLLLIACLWVGIEYLRSVGYLGLPTGLAGYQLMPNLYLIQSASLFGIYGLSFFVLLINVLILLMVQRKRSIAGRLGLTLLIAGLIITNVMYGKSVLARNHNFPTIKAAIIQANIKPDKKWDVSFIQRNITKHKDLSKLTLIEKPDIIIWPETAVACFLLYPARENIIRDIRSFARETGTPLLIGTQDIKVDVSRKDAFNSAVLISKNGAIMDKYDKMKLVPFVEHVVVKSWIPFFRKIPGFLPIYEPGKRVTTFTAVGQEFSTLICYEALFPSLVRDSVKKGARWLVNITNDEPALKDKKFYYKVNADMTRMRAIENRRSIARAANTGISMFIDPFGRVLKRSGINDVAAFAAAFPVTDEQTPYTRFGDIIAFISLGLVGIRIALVRRKN